jgi:nicotinate-nucleotide adenylyltransferase
MGYNKAMRIGIYGGAFDPIHSEHIKIMEYSQKELALDRLILLPSFSPPHKNTEISPFEIRTNMLRAATAKLDFVYIDEREYNSEKEKNCAYEVLQSVRNDYPDDELIYIIGGDSMIKFHTWVQPHIIAGLMPIAVVARKGYQGLELAIEYAQSHFNAQITVLSFVGEEISSSEIKAAYALGMPSNDVPETVDSIIKQQGLYQNYKDIVNKLKESISEELFLHCANTTLYALRLANKLDLNYDDVFLSALLHDCAKESAIAEQYKEYPKKIAHQFQGAELAKTQYGIENPKVLAAINYHTTGRKAMSTLEKLIFSADMLEPLRDYEGVEALRELIEKDFEKGFAACIKASLDKLEKSGREVFYLTRECYEYYK